MHLLFGHCHSLSLGARGRLSLRIDAFDHRIDPLPYLLIVDLCPRFEHLRTFVSIARPPCMIRSSAPPRMAAISHSGRSLTLPGSRRNCTRSLRRLIFLTPIHRTGWCKADQPGAPPRNPRTEVRRGCQRNGGAPAVPSHERGRHVLGPTVADNGLHKGPDIT